ncbi:hypothetical protein WDW89_25345 [Deltaproteobacteria bacterium TL4]
MLTTLDAKPQEWMEGSESVLHTVSACHFQNIEHAEYWIDKLIPKDANNKSVKGSGGEERIALGNFLLRTVLDTKIKLISK